MILKNLKAIRLSRGLSQKSAARLLNQSKSTVSAVEVGLTDLKVSTLMQYAKAYGVRPSDILVGEYDTEKPVFKFTVDEIMAMPNVTLQP